MPKLIHDDRESIRVNYTAAQTDTAILTATATERLQVLSCSAMLDKDTTPNVQCRVGFGLTTTPTGASVVLTHPGIAPGSGVIEAEPSLTGALDEDLRITCEVPTDGSLDVLVKYIRHTP